MRLVLTLFGRVVFDLAILEDPAPDDEPGGYERADATTQATGEARIGFVDDVGAGPWE